MTVDAVKPDLATKRHWFDLLRAPKQTLSFTESREVMWTLLPYEQSELALTLAPDYYAFVRANGRSENEVFVETFARSLAPLACDAKASAPYRQLAADAKDFTPSVWKVIRVVLQEDELCQRVRAASAL